MHRWVAIAVCLGPGCAAIVARPSPPRVATSTTDLVRIDHLRNDAVALAVQGPHHVTAVGLAPPIASSEPGRCLGSAGAALRLGPEAHAVGPRSPGETLVEARFDGAALRSALEEPMALAVQLDGGAPDCLRLTLSAADPAYRWEFPGSDGPINVGEGLRGFALRADGHRWGGGFEWDLLRVGKWLGPIRPSLDLGLVVASRGISTRLGLQALGYPLVTGRFALGVAAGYDLQPIWSNRFSDGDRFKWAYGPRAELHLAYTARQLLGFPAARKLDTVALVLWGSREDADHYRAELFGLGLELH